MPVGKFVTSPALESLDATTRIPVHTDFLMVLAFCHSNYQIVNFAKTYSMLQRNIVQAYVDNYKLLQASRSHNISQMASVIVLLPQI